jgi:hypothetical protein
VDPRKALLIACLLACSAGCGRKDESAELVAPKTSGLAKNVRFASPQEAARTLLPNFQRTIPLSTFGGAPGLSVGVKIEAQTEGGKTIVGTVKAIGKDSVVIDVESWSWRP